MTDRRIAMPFVHRRDFLRGSVAAAGALALPGLGTKMVFAQSGDTFKVGFVRVLTGRFASSFAPTAVAALIAFDEVNAAGGINGRRVEPIEMDDEAAPAKQPGLVLQMKDAGIQYAVGPVGSSAALSALAASTEAKIMSTTFALGIQFGDGDLYPYHYQCMCNTQQTSSANARYVVESLGIKKVGILTDDLEFGKQSADFAEIMLKELGAEMVGRQDVPASSPDAAPYVENLQRSGAEAILCYISSVPLTAQAFNTMVQIGWLPPVVGINVIFRKPLRDLLPDNALDNLYGHTYRTLTWSDSYEPGEKQKQFAESLKKHDIAAGAEVPIAHGPFYDFIHMLKLVIDDQKDFDVEKTKAAMDNVKGYEGLLGTFNFTPKQHCGLDDSAIVIAEVASVRDEKANGLFRKQAPGQ